MAEPMLRPLWVAAALVGRPRSTVRTWYRRGLLTTVACDRRTREVLVDLWEVRAVAVRSRRRDTPTAEPRHLPST